MIAFTEYLQYFYNVLCHYEKIHTCDCESEDITLVRRLVAKMLRIKTDGDQEQGTILIDVNLYYKTPSLSILILCLLLLDT